MDFLKSIDCNLIFDGPGPFVFAQCKMRIGVSHFINLRAPQPDRVGSCRRPSFTHPGYGIFDLWECQLRICQRASHLQRDFFWSSRRKESRHRRWERLRKKYYRPFVVPVSTITTAVMGPRPSVLDTYRQSVRELLLYSAGYLSKTTREQMRNVGLCGTKGSPGFICSWRVINDNVAS